MSRIAEEIIQDIRERVDIVEVVGRYVQLKRSGANNQGLCPFHQEKTPSFNVNGPRQIFHCFGCGVGGNVFTFLMKIDGISFPEAVKRLGEQVGIEVEDRPLSPAEIQRREENDRLFQINAAASRFYHHLLVESEHGAAGRRYLRQRGYEGETVRAFELGFAPDDWEALAGHLAEKDFKVDEARQSGLVRPGKQDRGDYDLFRNRLLFPIHDLQGRPIAFGGRVLDNSTPKYINSPESPVYHKGQILYGLYQARDSMRQTDQALVVEGYFDVMALHRAGFANAVATCGTALTPDHARLLKRYAATVLLVFDEDAAGRQATFRAMDELLPEGVTVKVVSLPAGDDPDSILEKQGADAFAACLAQARPVLELFLEVQLQNHGDSVEGRAKAAEEVLRRLWRLPSDLERDLYLKMLAERTGLDEALLRRRRPGKAPAAGERTPSAQSVRRAPAERADPVVPAQQKPVAPAREQGFLLRLMMVEPGVRRQVRDEGVAELFLDPECRAIAEHLLAVEADGELPADLMSPDLSEAQNALVAGLLIEGLASWSENPERIFADCRAVVAGRSLKAQLQELKRLKQQAEQSGDEAEMLRYDQQIFEIVRKMKK